MKNFKKQKGITLVALVVTIIVLLILAGVSLSLVAGENGILGRATGAVKKNYSATAKEQTSLLIADYVGEYYEEVYVNGKEVTGNFANQAVFIANKLTTTGQKTDDGNYTVKIDNVDTPTKITVSGKGLEKDLTANISEKGVISGWSDETSSSTGGDTENT